nr:nitrous-oxide reductase accessory protein [uncultured bacterium]
MNHLPRVLMVLAAVLLISMFFFPMWKITLIAPQYPQGVTMHIFINKIGGEEPGTLQNINILNHYIGMKKIEPDAIPELKIFPYVIIGMIALGLLAALMNKRSLFLAWAIIFIVLAIVGLYDFYLWEYDYGHTLDPKAPMKFPGASFTPPLIGSKDIINFTAKSFPHISGYLAGASVLISLVAWWLKLKLDTKNENTAIPDVSYTNQ